MQQSPGGTSLLTHLDLLPVLKQAVRIENLHFRREIGFSNQMIEVVSISTLSQMALTLADQYRWVALSAVSNLSFTLLNSYTRTVIFDNVSGCPITGPEKETEKVRLIISLLSLLIFLL